MLIFVAIAIACFVLITGSFIFGHDHDVGMDHDHDFSHDGGEATISIFSVKVIATFGMGFGAAGAIARNYEASSIVASLIGVGCGAVLAGLMYAFLAAIYSQQASSLVSSQSLVGQIGTVTVSIEPGSVGEVGINAGGQYMTYSAVSATGEAIHKDAEVRVVRASGSQLVVQKA